MKNPFALIKKLGFACAWHKMKRRIFINDKDIISRIACNGAYDYLQKYKYVLDFPIDQCSSDLPNPCPNKIWTMWLQGVDNAPELVKKCIASNVSQHGKDVVILDSTNVSQYIEIPDYITQKWEAGIIPNAHYSDVLRILLLAKYGGVWIDSTIWLFAPVPAYIRKADVFVFKVIPMAHVMAANNFIAAQANNIIVLKMKNLLLEYWKNENKLASYSIFHLFFAMTVNTEKELWQSIPYFDAISNTILQMELFDKFNQTRIEQIKQISPIQKLSWKFPNEKFTLVGTNYDELIKKNNIL
jgi:hypothetical protein